MQHGRVIHVLDLLEAGRGVQDRLRRYAGRARTGGYRGTCRFEVILLLATQEDPLSRIYDLDSRSMGRGIIIGLLGALCVHAAGATEASHLADSMGGWALDTRSRVHGYLAHLYDVELVEPPPAPSPSSRRAGARTRSSEARTGRREDGTYRKAPPPPPRKREPS